MQPKDSEKQSKPEAAAPSPGFLKRLLAVIRHPAFKILIAITILVFLYKVDRFKTEDFEGLKDSWQWVVVGGLALTPCLLVGALRLKVLLGGVGLKCRFGQTLSWTMIGVLFDVVMPSSTGGDFIKVFYVVRAFGRGQRGVAGTCVFVDRIVGLVGLMLYGLFVCLVSWDAIGADEKLSQVAYILMAVCACTFVGFLVFGSKRVRDSGLRRAFTKRLPFGEAIERVYLGLAGIRRRALLAVLGLSVLNHAFLSGVLLIFAKGLGIEIDVAGALVVLPLALFLNSFGVFGGVGVGQAAFDYLFETMLGCAKGVGASLATVFHVVGAIVKVLFGLPFYVLTGGRKTEEGAATPSGE